MSIEKAKAIHQANLQEVERSYKKKAAEALAAAALAKKLSQEAEELQRVIDRDDEAEVARRFQSSDHPDRATLADWEVPMSERCPYEQACEDATTAQQLDLLVEAVMTLGSTNELPPTHLVPAQQKNVRSHLRKGTPLQVVDDGRCSMCTELHKGQGHYYVGFEGGGGTLPTLAPMCAKCLTKTFGHYNKKGSNAIMSCNRT